jgi:diguanylate cyclase (GGDEF)-like protein/PAS domain S-box-containing protein
MNMSESVCRTVRILMLEDVAEDAELTCHILRQAGLKIVVDLVADEDGFRAGLMASPPPDIVLSDFSLPAFDGLSALILRSMLAPGIPFIFVTGALGEERAVDMVRVGASDYVIKGNLQRLPVAVLRALAQADDARIRQTMELQLGNERLLLGAVLDTSGALIVLIDRDGRILRLNPIAAQTLTLPAEEATGVPFETLFSTLGEQPTVRQHLQLLHELAPGERRSWQATVSTRKVIWSAGCLPAVGDGEEFAVVSGLDITAQYEAEQQAYFLRHFDSTTGLPNRELLLQRMMSATPGGQSHAALVMIGLSRLQDVRDSMGGEAANLLLSDAARRLVTWMRPGDFLARIGDDSFALMIAEPPATGLDAMLQDMLDRLHLPYPLNTKTFFLSAHLGVAYQEHHDRPEEVLREAATALHLAMRQQDEHYHFYQPMLSDEARMRLELEAELHAALAVDNQLFLDYQPQVEIGSGRIVGVEALMRWHHPRHGLLSPMRFIGLAESCGLIQPLGERALLIACRQARAWQDQGLASIPVAVNLSALQWSQRGLVETICDTLAQCGLDARWLELELTESASMQNPVATLSTMMALRDMGVQLSIDDFGTGFCNLSYLKRFPVDKLKIDQSFVRDLTSQPDDLVISSLVVAMGHLLRLSVVAEGVETEGQRVLLAEAGCDSIQGYLFCRPVDAGACARLLASEAHPCPGLRRRHPRHVLWLDSSASCIDQGRAWLEDIGCQVLDARSLADAFELLATHNVNVAVIHAADSECAPRLRDMYPALGLLCTGSEVSKDGVESLDGPLARGPLQAAVERLLARAPFEGRVQAAL